MGCVSTEPGLNTVPITGPRRSTCPSVVATDVLLLRPHGVAGTPSTEGGLFPMFVMVVTEPTDQAAAAALPLFEQLYRPKYANELSVLAVESAWSILDPANALLTLTVRAALPVSFDVRIMLPAAPVLDILEVVARGATIGITTRERAARLRGLVDVRTALNEVVLLSCQPSADLADLADVLRAVRES